MTSSSGPFAPATPPAAACAAPTVCVAIASNLPFGSGVVVQQVFTGSPGPRQHPFGSGHHARIRPVMRENLVEDQKDLPVSCCLSATGVRLLGHPVPAAGLNLPHGRPTGSIATRTQRGFHVPHGRDTTGVGALLTPRRRCPPGWGDLLQPAPAASQRPALHPTTTSHRRGLGSRGIIEGSFAFTRPVFPWPVAPGWNGNPRA